jgi:hypothetical protein
VSTTRPATAVRLAASTVSAPATVEAWPLSD